MKVFNKKVSDLERVEWNRDLSEFYAQKIPCESNCPYMVVTDTLNCQKEFEGLVDMERCGDQAVVRFGPTKAWGLSERVRILDPHEQVFKDEP